MPWNGSGTFNRNNGVNSGTQVWQDDAAAGTKIRADYHDTHDQDIADGLENAVARDGQNSPSANLPMNSLKHTGVDTTSGQSSRSEYAATAVLQDGDIWLLSSVAGTDTITASVTPTLSAYAAGQFFFFVAAGTNTGATTLNINSVGAKAIQKNGAALVAGDITASDGVLVFYDGTQFQMMSPARTPVLANASIGTAALVDASITTAKINDGAVSTAKIADNAVTLAKMASGTASKLIGYDGSGDPAEVDGVSAASQAQMEAASATDVYVSPGTAKHAPGAAKAWAYVTVSGGTPTLAASHNVASIDDDGAGDFGINFTTAMSSANYAAVVSAYLAGGNRSILQAWSDSRTTASVELGFSFTTSNALGDPTSFDLVVFGDFA